MNEHSSKQFDEELDEIRAMVTRMGGMVEEQARAALRSFSEHDRDLIERVVMRDQGVDEMEIQIDEACAHVIAKRQPTAIDLRLITAVSKMVTDLERIGDEAKKIAKATREILDRSSPGRLTQTLEVMNTGNQAIEMLHDVLDAFVRLDAESATDIIRRDKQIGEHFRAILRQLVTYMMEDPRTISTALDIIFIAKSVERIGDHAKNIAKDVIYIAKGRDVRHLGLSQIEAEVNAS
jgi:phosphate transport system protein